MKNSKAKTLWQKAKLSFDEDRIDEMRAVLSLPPDGISTTVTKEWPLGNIGEKLALLNSLAGFVDEVAAMSNYVAAGFSVAIEEYILSGDVKESTLKKCDTTGCMLKFVGSDEATTEMPIGFYLSLGSYSTPTDAKAYLLKRAKFIKDGRKLVYGNESVRPKMTNYYLNETILWLWSMEINELRRYAVHTFKLEYGHLSRKDALISNILEKLGVKVSSDSVRKAASRKHR